MSKVEQTVAVNVQLAIHVTSSWSEDTTLAQIERQAKESAKNVVRKGATARCQILSYGEVTIESRLGVAK